ncbi:MAG: alanine dehydrogenase [Burkholderiales bacterium]
MRIGIPKEIKDHEFRAGATPSGVKALAAAGHEVWVETNAGMRIGFGDELYREAGARIAATAAEVYGAEMIIKVKEPQPSEYPLLREGQILFGYLHLSPVPELAAALLQRKIVGIAYETVGDAQGGLPLLIPMSEVAGRLAVQAGARSLEMACGGNGTLLGGVPGVAPAKVLVIGGGTVGSNAAKMAVGLGADVTILDVNPARLRYLDDIFGARIKTRYFDADTLDELSREADLAIGAILIPGKLAPRLLTRPMIAAMKPGSVLVDVSIDQGGIAETSRATTHSSPTYVEEGVVHYCVANMPAAAARTATLALTQVTLPYALQLAGLGYRQALAENAHLREGLNLHLGHVTHPAVAQDLGYEYVSPQQALATG